MGTPLKDTPNSVIEKLPDIAQSTCTVEATRKEMKKGRRLVPMDERTPECLPPGTVRRPCLFRYQCPACGREHEAPYYISTTARTRAE